MTGKRYVVLQFDDGDRFDYEPPLPHPADVFLERFPVSQQLNADIGAPRAVEVTISSGVRPADCHPVLGPTAARSGYTVWLTVWLQE